MFFLKAVIIIVFNFWMYFFIFNDPYDFFS